VQNPRLIRPLVLFNVAVLGGLLLNHASHLHHGGTVERGIFGAYIGAVAAHFVIDAGLWRLRDDFPRRFVSAHLPYLVRPPTAPGRVVERAGAP
jgi:hypothetical protein